ncbi:MAG: hypothetical protein WD750_10040 [Gammaproteobacteria bacterium]
MRSAGIAAAGLGTATLLRPSLLFASTGAGLKPLDRELLASVARSIFPHDRVPRSLYIRIAEQVAAQARNSPAEAEVLQPGLVRVRELAAPRGWPKLGRDDRVAILRELDGGAFFNLVRNTAAQVLYRDERVWKLIGYGGNALARGGYLDSFDNIDWLPDED